MYRIKWSWITVWLLTILQVFSIREAATNNLKRLAEEFGPEWAMQHIVPQVFFFFGSQTLFVFLSSFWCLRLWFVIHVYIFFQQIFFMEYLANCGETASLLAGVRLHSSDARQTPQRQKLCNRLNFLIISYLKIIVVLLQNCLWLWSQGTVEELINLKYEQHGLLQTYSQMYSM